eukprot:scaffold16302_cov136-Isochrysis_galbana.AAC.6
MGHARPQRGDRCPKREWPCTRLWLLTVCRPGGASGSRGGGKQAVACRSVGPARGARCGTGRARRGAGRAAERWRRTQGRGTGGKPRTARWHGCSPDRARSGAARRSPGEGSEAAPAGRERQVPRQAGSTHGRHIRPHCGASGGQRSRGQRSRTEGSV